MFISFVYSNVGYEDLFNGYFYEKEKQLPILPLGMLHCDEYVRCDQLQQKHEVYRCNHMMKYLHIYLLFWHRKWYKPSKLQKVIRITSF